MKIRNILLFLICIIFVSCGEDRRLEYGERTNLTHWMKDTMEHIYYWDEHVAELTSLNYHARPEAFFKSLLYSGDSYSMIEEKTGANEVLSRSIQEVSYGFEYFHITHPQKPKALIARVLYTLPNSSAADAGLERGDWIFGFNDTTFISNNIDTLLSGKATLKLLVGRLDSDGEPVETTIKTLEPKGVVANNPVYYKSIFPHAGKTIGYVVYNSFVAGTDGNTSYLTELSNLSDEFAGAGVEEVILDLRYNTGGELNRPVPLICSMLAPATAMDKPMGYTEFNEKNTDKNEYFNFSRDYLLGGSNLNLSRVFVLVNRKFTASASEAVIHFLKPYMDEVVLVGSGTVGKNVGSLAIEDSRYGWILHPIVCKLYNSEENTYTSGFTPTYPVDELDKTVLEMLPLGDKKELLLSTALSVIDGTYGSEEEEDETRGMFSNTKYNGSSLDRKSLPGVIIRRR